MIIKVPIYLEIERIDEPEALPILVKHLGDTFTIILRKEDFEKGNLSAFFKEVETHVGKFKIIRREKALDYIRTKK